MRTYRSTEESERLGSDAGIEDPAFQARLQAAIEADPQAVEELVREFQPNLTAYAKRRKLRDPDGVVNQTLSDGLRNLPTFRGRDRRAFRAYLYQILRRRIVDEHRLSARQPVTLAEFPHDLEAKLIDETSSSFDESVVARSTVDDILANLTTEQREILEMRVLTGLSIRETATRTGRSETAVKAMHRRAIRSLRTVVFAAVVLALAIIGIRMLITAGGTVEVVDNSPASRGEQSLGNGLPDDVPLVEVELGEGEPAAVAADESETETAADRAEALDSRFVVVGNSVSATDPAPEDPAGVSEPSGPVIEPVPLPVSPCSVRTDANPKSGEIAFVTFDFSGPYEFFESTSIDVLGAESSSALFPGTGGTGSVKHGSAFPIILDDSMFPRKEPLSVTATLAGGEVSTTCTLSDEVLPHPCAVAAPADPAIGDTATITFQPAAPWSLLRARHTRPRGPGLTSAFPTDTAQTLPLRNKGPHDFVLGKNMLTTERPWVVIDIFGPAPADDEERRSGRAVCELS